MNWFKENKFVAGFVGAVVVASGGLGFMALSASGRLEEATTAYEEQATELNRLHQLDLFPDKKNLEAVEKQRNEHQKIIDALHQTLRANQFPLEDISDVQFQDRLKETVQRVTAKATEKGVVFDKEKKFYLGFDQYESEPPRPEVAPLLGRQLKAIEFVVMQMLESNAVKFEKIERPPLAQEKEKGKGAERSEKSERPDKLEKKAERALLTKSSFDLYFTIDQAGFRSLLNTIVSNKQQFYIPTRIEIKNQSEKGPSRGGVAGKDAPVDGAEPVPPKPTKGVSSEKAYIVGDEKLDVSLRLEIVDFGEGKKK